MKHTMMLQRKRIMQKRIESEQINKKSITIDIKNYEFNTTISCRRDGQNRTLSYNLSDGVL